MRVYISSFSPSKSFQFVNDQLSWEEENFHHHDYHDPPHALRVGLYDDQYPPQRLAAVARSDHWKTTPAQVGFPRASNPKVKIALVWEGGLLSEQHWRGLVLSEELPSGCLQVKRGLVVQAIWYIVTADNAATKTLLMGNPAKTLDSLIKVVVGFLNGGRIKGYIYDFSALEESFNLLPQEDPLQGEEIKVEMKDLKAVFFVWEFTSNPEHHDLLRAAAPMEGRKIEVTFTDGEKIVGKTTGYNPQRNGFFMYPADPRGNNIRIFVVTRNTRQVKLV
jgi:hypothetical protein